MPTNIAATSDITGKTSIGQATEAGSTIASNPTGSGKIFRVGSLMIANVTGSVNADVLVGIRRGGSESASSIYLDGSSRLTLGSKVGLSFTGDFTIEAFLYMVSNQTRSLVLECRSYDSSINYAFGVANSSFQRLVWITGSGQTLGSSQLFLGKWNHIAAVRSGSTVNFYVNGLKDATSVTLSGTLTASANTPGVGNGVNGFLEEVRVSTVARYSGDSFVVPTSAFADNDADTTLLLHGNGANDSLTFDDSVGSPHAITRVGTARVSTANSVFSGDERRLAHKISVPANSTLAVLEKPIYLEEGDRLVCSASTNERLEYVCSFEEIG